MVLSYSTVHIITHKATLVLCMRALLTVCEFRVQVKVVADKPQAADEALKADVQDLLTRLRLANAQLVQNPPAAYLDMTEELEEEAHPADGDQKWPLEHFLQREMRLEDTESRTQSSSSHGERTSVEDKDPQENFEKHVVCIISNDRGFDKLLNECKRAGCRTMAISDLTKSTYKHADVLLSWSMAKSGMY